MNAPNRSRALWIFIACLCLMEGAVFGAPPELLPFWKLPAVELPPKLLPAKVELVAGPDLTRALALFDPDHKVTNPLTEPFVKKADEDYRVVPSGLVKGAKPFSDRNYTISVLPDRLAGLTQLQTRMSHKNIIDGRFGIALSVARPVYLFVAMDERMLKTFAQTGTPSWMQDFAPTGDRILTDDPLMKATESGYLIFVKKCPAGRIVLGPCGANPKYNSMYFTFLAEAGQDGR
ncbi:MAG: hypothetical protein ABMA26_21065 [Limisphaerales bacterium]